jgi:tRNA-2-methylthio-N6-dimethylallyladenosine synthase
MRTKSKQFFIKTFGCIQNTADSEKIKAYFWDKGYENTDNWEDAEVVVINSCVVRESAENRVYGLIDKIRKSKL